MEKIEGRELIVLAAVLGGTNMGMSIPERNLVRDLLEKERPRGRELDIDAATIVLWQGYMESDEIMEAFLEETKHWLNTVLPGKDAKKAKPIDKAYVRRVWPDAARVMGWVEGGENEEGPRARRAARADRAGGG